MRISDWSSDVCSSDLRPGDRPAVEIEHPAGEQAALALAVMRDPAAHRQFRRTGNMEGTEDGILRGIVRTAVIDRIDQHRNAQRVGQQDEFLAPVGTELAEIGRASGREKGRQYV